MYYNTNSELCINIFNKILQNEIYSANWKTAREALILKEGKDLQFISIIQFNFGSGNRPICLVPIWRKIAGKNSC